MNLLVISTSLRGKSRSRIMARVAHIELTTAGHSVDFIDLLEYTLPHCDGGASYGHPSVVELKARIQNADGIVMAVPVYNYDISAAGKNLVELTGSAWENKVAGFLCAAGGASSYMSIMGFANSLMLDFRTVIVPRFVYATGADFDATSITNGDVERRVRQLAGEVARFSSALRG